MFKPPWALLCLCSSQKLFRWICPSEKCTPGDWIDYAPPPLSLLFFSLFQGTGQPQAHHPQPRALAAGPRGEMNHLQWEIMIAGFSPWKWTCTSSGVRWSKKILANSRTSKQYFLGFRNKSSFLFTMIFFTKKPQPSLYINLFNCRICTLGIGRWENPYKISSSRQNILCVESFKGLSDSPKLAGCSHCTKLDYMGKNSWSECRLAVAAAYKPMYVDNALKIQLVLWELRASQGKIN